MKRLRANYGVERIRRHLLGPGKIGDYARPPVALLNVEHVGDGDALASVFLGVEGVLDLQHTPSYFPGMAGEKAFDVVSIDRRPPVQAVVPANGVHPPKVTKTYASSPQRTFMLLAIAGASSCGTASNCAPPRIQAQILFSEPLDLPPLFGQFLLQESSLSLAPHQAAQTSPCPFNVSLHC